MTYPRVASLVLRGDCYIRPSAIPLLFPSVREVDAQIFWDLETELPCVPSEPRFLELDLTANCCGLQLIGSVYRVRELRFFTEGRECHHHDFIRDSGKQFRDLFAGVDATFVNWCPQPSVFDQDILKALVKACRTMHCLAVTLPQGGWDDIYVVRYFRW